MRFLDWLRVDIFGASRSQYFECRKKIYDDKVIARRWTKSRRLRILSAHHGADCFVPLPAASPYCYQIPQIINAPNFINEDLAQEHAKNPIQAPPGGLSFFKDATVLATGVVMTATGDVIEESLANTGDYDEFWPLRRNNSALDLQIGRQLTMPRSTNVPHVLLKQSFDENYGHWLIEGLPRAALMAELFDVKRFKFIIGAFGGKEKKVYYETLRAYGVEPEQVVEVGHAPIHVDTLIYPLPMTRHSFVKSPTSIRLLEQLNAKAMAQGGGPTRIYVSRNRFSRRLLLNEADIIESLLPLGFEIIYPELMSFEDQVKAFANAEMIVGNCGAALSNIVFSPRGSAVIALASEYMHDGFFWDLASVKDQNYTSLHGKVDSNSLPTAYTDKIMLDFTIDVGILEGIVRNILKVAR